MAAVWVGEFQDLTNLIHLPLGGRERQPAQGCILIQLPISLGVWPYLPGCLVQGVSFNPDVPLKFGQHVDLVLSDGEFATRAGRLGRPSPVDYTGSLSFRHPTSQPAG